MRTELPWSFVVVDSDVLFGPGGHRAWFDWSSQLGLSQEGAGWIVGGLFRAGKRQALLTNFYIEL